MKQLHQFLVAMILCQCTAQAQVAVMGELSHDTQAIQGETYEGVITLRNDFDEPQEAKIYQTDYLFSCDGTNSYGVPGSTERSNALWITFSPAHVVVPPRGTTEINYVVKVPSAELQSLSGTYWSMIMIEGILTGSPESSLRPASGEPHMGIRQTIRYGVQLATHIMSAGVKDISFLDARLTRSDQGDVHIQVDIANNGNLGARPEVYVELFDQHGVSKGKFNGIRYRLYPGTSVRQNIPLNGIPSGTYKALVVIDDGNSDVFGAEYTLEI